MTKLEDLSAKFPTNHRKGECMLDPVYSLLLGVLGNNVFFRIYVYCLPAGSTRKTRRG